MSPEIIATIDDFRICRQYQADEAIIRLLEATTWGIEDTRYEHFLVRHHLAHIPHPVYFTLHAPDAELVGVIVFCRRRVHEGIKAYYIRYFASHPSIRGRGLVSRVAPLVMDRLRREESGPVLFYASTEYYNQRVLRIVQAAGFEQLAETYTLGFSRFSPRQRGLVRALSSAEFEAFLPTLQDFYRDYAFWMTDNIGVDGDYYALWEGDRIVAAAQVYRGLWRVENMGGAIGKTLLPLVPYTPLRRIFDPHAFRFLAFEGIYLRPGSENRLQDLFETLLHQQNYHAALWWMVAHDPLRSSVLQHNRLGLLHLFARSVRARFIAAFHQLPAKEEADIRRRPFYISALDYI